MIANSQKWCSSQNLCAACLLKACIPFRSWIVFSHLVSVYQKCPAVCHSQKLKAENWGALLAVALAGLCWVGSPRWWKLWVCTVCSFWPIKTPKFREVTVVWKWGMQCPLWSMWSKLMNCEMENAAGFLQGGFWWETDTNQWYQSLTNQWYQTLTS